MRIAMLSWRSPGDPRAGGAERLTLELLRRAAALGHEVWWFAASFPGAADEETADGIRFVRRGRQWTVHAHAFGWLRRRRADFDVVVDQVNTLPFLTPLYLPAATRRLLIFQTAREYWWRETRGPFRALAPLGYLAEPLYLKAYRRTTTVTISESTRRELIARGFDASRIRVIDPGITVPVLERLEPKPEPLRIVVLGRLTPAKFVEEALAAFALVRAALPSSRLDVVGAGDAAYRARLERDAAERGLGASVAFHGRVVDERKFELLEQATFHLFTSHREGWGLTVTEAGARGTPTVGYDAPGVRDSIADRRLLVSPAAGARGLAERIVSLAADAAVYEDVRAAAWRRARTLSGERAAAEFLEALGA